ncbi:hypothetical protein RUM43_003955, partial [Polyplax serrata]
YENTHPEQEKKKNISAHFARRIPARMAAYLVVALAGDVNVSKGESKNATQERKLINHTE